MKGFSLNSIELQEYQQNRYPYLMIDYVDEVIPGKSSNGYKNLTLNEWFFPKHYPANPNYPGALQIESLAQMLTIAITTLPGNKGKETLFVSVFSKFKKEVLPGDKFVLETKVTSWKRGLLKGVGVGYTNGTIACEAELVITLPDILKQYLPSKEKK